MKENTKFTKFIHRRVSSSEVMKKIAKMPRLARSFSTVILVDDQPDFYAIYLDASFLDEQGRHSGRSKNFVGLAYMANEWKLPQHEIECRIDVAVQSAYERLLANCRQVKSVGLVGGPV